ncbi:hypothetical protein NQ117_18290 [Paenibacillus sp. SC116]|uniref:hypothetical protein n=1 Tax=Paenibacillus sp. SC116 TaxID=2968986 RepID=UPI00215B194B|nr:hypothetical protein [Paenibacillus sp. SC116]MCR8845637.1 hypothetical protein [Paenibacillus sp. SC116]
MRRKILSYGLSIIFITLISLFVSEQIQILNYKSVELIATDVSESDFLSREYFEELNSLYKRIKMKNDKWYVFDGSSHIAATAVITRMISDLENAPDTLINHENFHQYFIVFDKNIRKLDSITEQFHYFRNVLNSYGDAPEKLDEMIKLAAGGKWGLFSSKYHMYNYKGMDGAFNVKFISEDGRFEAVYNTGTGELVSDPVNMGTYNFAPGSINPIKYLMHNKYDKIPWKKWGNTREVAYHDIINFQSGYGSLRAKSNFKKVEEKIALIP